MCIDVYCFMAQPKKRMNFSVPAHIVEECQRLSEVFPSINWSEHVSVFLTASVEYLVAAESAHSDGRISKLREISLPTYIQMPNTLNCLAEEFQKAPESRIADVCKTSVLRDMADKFNAVFCVYDGLGTLDGLDSSEFESSEV